MLCKHSLNTKHSSQQGPNSSGQESVVGQSQVASVSPFALALSLLSGTCLQTTIGAQGCVLTRTSLGASKEKLGLLPTLSGHVQLPAPRVSSVVFLVLWLGLSLSILSLGAGVGVKKNPNLHGWHMR